jgi:hypothetical protein
MGTAARVIVLLSMMLTGLAVAPRAHAQAVALQSTAPLNHRHQTGLSLMPGYGYQVIVPYEENKPCGDSSGMAGKRVCTNHVPLFLDLQLSFGVTERIDLLTDLRFSLTQDPAARRHSFTLMPGIRIWLDPDTQLKFYATLQLVYDSTDYSGVVKSDDFGVRNSNGLMYDVIRNVGFYFQFGETIGFIRWFRIGLDAGLGVQVRFP